MSGPATTIAVAVVVKRGQVLVGRRSAEAAEAAGLDEFPGGKVEAGETAAAAAARECLEETGLAVRIGTIIAEALAPGASGPLRVVFLWAEPVDDAARPRPPFCWLAFERLGDLRFPPANAGVLAALARLAAADQGGS